MVHTLYAPCGVEMCNKTVQISTTRWEEDAKRTITQNCEKKIQIFVESQNLFDAHSICVNHMSKASYNEFNSRRKGFLINYNMACYVPPSAGSIRQNPYASSIGMIFQEWISTSKSHRESSVYWITGFVRCAPHLRQSHVQSVFQRVQQ